jgi:sugar phosphate isomerase/epimerase
MRHFSLAYLSAHALTPPQVVDVAAQAGYSHVGLRLLPSTAGGASQPLMTDAALLRATQARLRDTGVAVMDLEVLRIGADFDPQSCLPMFETGAALQARAVLAIGEDTDEARLAERFARLCALAVPFGLSIDLEFLPWTTVPDARSALRVLQRAGMPANAGVLVDALHAARSSTTLDDIAALPRAHLHYAQICDAPLGGPFTLAELLHTARLERLLPGEGGIDLRRLFAQLPDDLPVSVEIPHHTRVPQCGELDWARQALQASMAVLAAP